MLRSYGLKFRPRIDFTRSSRETMRPAARIRASRRPNSTVVSESCSPARVALRVPLSSSTSPADNTKGTRNTRNNQDGIFNGGGSQLILDVSQTGQSYAATFNIGLEGVPDTGVSIPPPVITGASISGKRLIVTGQNFDSGATLFMNGDRQRKTGNDETNPTTVLIARKAGNLISAGQTVILQVRNSDNTLSNEYSFTRAVE